MKLFRKKQIFFYLIIAVFLISFFLFFDISRSGKFSSHSTEYPARIISLGPSITEDIYLLNAGDQLIANTVYCKNPTDDENKEKIGTLIKINIEKIASLKPDIVLSTPLTGPKQIKKLENLRIKVVTFSGTHNFSEVCQDLLLLGKLIGKEKDAREIISNLKIEVDHIKKITGKLPKKKIFIQIGARPLFTVTGDSFINDFIKFSGGINIALDAKSGLYSRENVINANPDVIIIAGMGIVGEEERNIWNKFKSMNAVKNNEIHIVDADLLCNPTPVKFVKGLKEIVKILHPEIKID